MSIPSFSFDRFRHLLAALLVAAIWSGGNAFANDEQDASPSSWEIRKSAIINLSRTHPAARFLPELVKKLAAKEGPGAPVSEAEFLALFDRPESRQVYADYLIKVATPRSVKIQNKEHADYSKVFLAEKRINRGVTFLKEQETLLKAAEQRYGVARKDIVSILMWESGLGEFTGDLRVFNVFMAQLLFLEEAQQEAVRRMVAKNEANPLTSPEVVETQKQRFDKIRRRCVGNMVALLRQCKATGVDPLTQRGSWAGAIGYPQFMPASMPHAADGDDDGDIDLHSWPDAVMSVGRYLKERGKYGTTEKSRRSAIFSYNPLDSYVDGVVAYADAIWARYEK